MQGGGNGYLVSTCPSLTTCIARRALSLVRPVTSVDGSLRGLEAKLISGRTRPSTSEERLTGIGSLY